VQIVFSVEKNLLSIISSIIDMVYSIDLKIHLLLSLVYRGTLCVSRIVSFLYSHFSYRDTHNVPRWTIAICKDNKNYLC
jgi:hypothetical protein